jgi:hypothetical protein
MAVAVMKKRPGAGEKTKGLLDMVIMTKVMPTNMIIMKKEMPADMIIMKETMPPGRMVVVASEKMGARARR